ncbi:MAG TPA: hypothetical protein VK186_04635, partial [Candidatus Deferrimicrobium sp.]|nr:hypothetical protein [Candidatus Deferrimicrobium sp.]
MTLKVYINKLMLFLMIMIAPGLILFSADTKDGKDLNVPAVIKKGATQVTIQGNLRNWDDIQKISLEQYGKPRRMRPVLNFERNLPLVSRDTTPDPVVQTTFSGEKDGLNRALAMPAPTKSYDGMNYTANGAGWPPDPNGDVGLNHYV